MDMTGGSCGGTSYSRFSYAPDKHRYQQVAVDSSGNTETTVYASGVEFVTKATSTVAHHMLSIYGEDVLTINIGDSTCSTMETICFDYLNGDQLGSIDDITDVNGNLVQTMDYSAFGQRRDATTGQTPASGTSYDATAHRGFTQHEMLDNLGLIHMNGRVYDPSLGRFLSVDPMFQFVTNGQSLNPYSYVLNNPLSQTDPTGYCVAGNLCFADGEHNRDSKGNLITKDAQQILDMKNDTTATIGSFTVSKDANGNVAIAASNGSQSSETPSDAQNKPSDSAGIGSPQQVSKTSTVMGTDAQSGPIQTQNIDDQLKQPLPIDPSNNKTGYGTVTEAALAQFHTNESKYQDSVKGVGNDGHPYELMGFIYGKDNRDYYSVMIRVPTAFEGTPKPLEGYSFTAFTHTHPDQTTFGGLDWVVPGATMRIPGIMKNSNEKAYEWDPASARNYGRGLGWMPGSIKYPVGPQNIDFSNGITPICPGDSACAN